MPSLAEVLDPIVRKLNLRIDSLTGKFEVASTAPFEVYLNGSSVAVAGIPLDGASYSVGTTGVYILSQGQQPICLPTP